MGGIVSKPKDISITIISPGNNVSLGISHAFPFLFFFNYSYTANKTNFSVLRSSS